MHELILYATPTGPLADACAAYFGAVEPTTAQTYPPHVTLTGFFHRRDAAGVIEAAARISNPQAGSSHSSPQHASVSDDGRYFAFASRARDLVLGQVSLVNHVGDGTTTGNDRLSALVLSADGSRIFFTSGASDLLPGMTATLERLEQTLSSADALISPESATALEIESLVGDLSEAADSLRIMAERLEEHPEELLRGKSE